MAGELQYINSWSESTDHQDMLINTIRNDLFPLRRRDLGGCTEAGAPFTISREFSCYVDYLGVSLHRLGRMEQEWREIRLVPS